MRTIIPFPQIHGVGSIQRSGSRRPKAATAFASFRAQLAAASAVDLPEGESMSSAIAQMPRAQALNQSIAGLIAAVEGRFGGTA